MKKRRKSKKKVDLGTIWEIPDALWERIEPILREFWPSKQTGRPVAKWRKVLNAIIFRMRSSCQWDQLPEKFGPKSTVHDCFQRWNKGGVMWRFWWPNARKREEWTGIGKARTAHWPRRV